MSNQKIKVVYSLKMHIALQQMGFVYLTEMKNPNNPYFNCWVYEETPAFAKAFDALIKEANGIG